MEWRSIALGEEERAEVCAIADRLLAEANAVCVVVTDAEARPVVIAGDASAADLTDVAEATRFLRDWIESGDDSDRDPPEVAALVALARTRSPQLRVSGQQERASCVRLVENALLVTVRFDERSSLGLVRLRLSKRVDALAEIVRRRNGPGGGPGVPPAAAASGAAPTGAPLPLWAPPPLRKT